MEIENTSTRNPLIHLAAAGTGAHSSYIEDMEAVGQRQLLQSMDLPTQTRGRDAEYEALGFTFGEPHPGDTLFRPATLPPGWKREGSDHAMWSYLVDEKGRKRVSIFYKAAYYDREAFMSLVAPEGRLMDAFYGDETPTSIELDDLLTREMAVKWLTDNRVDRLEYLEMATEQGRTAAIANYTAQVAKIDLMLSLLPPA